MHDFNEPPLPDLPPQPPPAEEPDIVLPRKKGWTLLSWLIIVGLVTYLVGFRTDAGAPEEQEKQDRNQDIVFEIQARYLIGAGNAFPDNARELYQQAAQMLDRGSLDQRLR